MLYLSSVLIWIRLFLRTFLLFTCCYKPSKLCGIINHDVFCQALPAVIPSTAKRLILFDKASRLVVRHQEKERLLEPVRHLSVLVQTPVEVSESHPTYAAYVV